MLIFLCQEAIETLEGLIDLFNCDVKMGGESNAATPGCAHHTLFHERPLNPCIVPIGNSKGDDAGTLAGIPGRQQFETPLVDLFNDPIAQTLNEAGNPLNADFL